MKQTETIQRFLFSLFLTATALGLGLFFDLLSPNSRNIGFFLFLYRFSPFLILLIIFRGQWKKRWQEEFSGLIRPVCSKKIRPVFVEQWFLWVALSLLSLGLSWILGWYQFSFTFTGLSDWMSDQLQFFTQENDLPIPSLPFRIDQIALIGLGSSVLGPLFLLPLSFVQEIVWRGWFVTEMQKTTRSAVLYSSFIWAMWQVPIVFFGKTTVSLWLDIPLFLLSATLQGIILTISRLRSNSIWPTTIGYSALFCAAPIPYILFEANHPFNPLLVGLFGFTGWVFMLAYLWFHRRYITQ